MKTDKFEKTIRQKLESISPDFQESDWAKMQNYMHAHTPPTLWQQYGSWIGYAAAASVTTVMAFLYVNQLSQNNRLSSDVKALQNQIAVIKEKPSEAPKADTVYIIRDATPTGQDSPSLSYRSLEPENSQARNTTPGHNKIETSDTDQLTDSERNIQDQRLLSATEPNRSEEPGSLASHNNRSLTDPIVANQGNTVKTVKSNESTELRRTIPSGVSDLPKNGQQRTDNELPNTEFASKHGNITPQNTGSQAVFASKTLGVNFANISTQTPITPSITTEQMNGTLMNRLSAKQIRKTWMASTANTYKAAASGKKTEQATQAENVVPQLNLKVPYRFGAGMEFQKNIQTKTVMGEVLIAKKFSISAGLSWLKLKQMQFFNEKSFREVNKRDFKQTHPNEVPAAFVVTNIQIEPTMMQIPLTVAFRNDLKDNWTYYMGAGANITVKSNEKISYSCIIPKPKQEILTQSFDRKMDISPINSLNFSLGIEKSWHPIVVQAEGYIYSYFKPLTPLQHRSGPGFKVKLLYQIGNKM